MKSKLLENEPSLIMQKIKMYCSYQERCIRDVEEKLKDLAVQRKRIPGIINKLQKDGYLNEERFARAFAGGKFRINKWGHQKIAFELKLRGIPELTIMEGLAEIDTKDYLQTLRDLILHKKNEIKDEKNFPVREKIITFALGKGYEIDEILDILKEMKI